MTQIILNESLKRISMPNPAISEIIDYHRRNIARRCEISGTEIGSMFSDGFERLHLGYIGLLSFAYSCHEAVRVTPHDLWFIFLGEIAKIVNKNSDACRSLFTSSADKIEIVVQTDDVEQIDPLVIIEKLQQLVPTDTLLFVPTLSTTDQDVIVAMAAMFADAVQSYYSYSTFLCGFPMIEVTGTINDWQKITTNAQSIGDLLRSVKLEKEAKFCERVSLLFSKILDQVRTGKFDVDFMKGLFTAKNIGSGGELKINGWITDLFLNKPSLPKIENFLSSYAVLPYKNIETGRHFKAVHGAFEQHRSKDNVLYSGYGHHIYEVSPKNA